MKHVGVLTSFCVIALMAPAPPAHADSVRERQWHLEFLDLARAHQHSQGHGVTIAVIDTGVDANHPDLRRNTLVGTDIVAGGSGDGRADAEGHGTAMAALAGAHGHGADEGALGIAPRSKILPIRVHTSTHTGDTEDNARAIRWAVDHGAHVVADALAGGVTRELLDAVRHAQRSDVVVVAAAGNRPEATGVRAPASLPGVVAAAAVDRNGGHCPDSVTGPEVILAAPGADVMSAANGGGYRAWSGTSNAAAIIAGAAALVRARFPDLSAAEVVHRLAATADDGGPQGRDEQYGYGVLNLIAALTADVALLDSTTRRPSGTVAARTASPPPRDPLPSSAVPALLLLLLLTGGTVGVVVARGRRA